ncbi:glycosyltransferase family 32 protein [Viridothelium virens]|uniref:Glycosyltransferase family 32 protein n=1 Tax=Viridothelium virens TaxID=1048519 RepID=A0A6A6GW06_VIRVR|nr:glycosyltransferase family 32 protein [Viridothelium virens]
MARKILLLVLSLLLVFYLATFCSPSSLSSCLEFLLRIEYQVPKFGFYDPDVHLPHKIWQTSTIPLHSFAEEPQNSVSDCIDNNPTHQYQLLTHGAFSTFVEEHFAHVPDIVTTFNSIDDLVLRTNYIRYLLLLTEGGAYVDVGTDCGRPIDVRIPAEYRRQAGMVLEVEYDGRDDTRYGMQVMLPAQFSTKTIIAKPWHPVMREVVLRMLHKLKTLRQQDRDRIHASDMGGVLATTGPGIFTAIVLDALSTLSRTQMTFENITDLQEPILIEDVLILPINASRWDQDHSTRTPRVQGENPGKRRGRKMCREMLDLHDTSKMSESTLRSYQESWPFN